MKIGIIQQSCSPDIAANKQKLAHNIRHAAQQGAELIVLQELHNTPYFCQTENVDHFDYAEPIPGPSTEYYGALAAELHIVLVTSLFERRAPGLYHNTAIVIDKDGSIAGKYRKMHIPDDPAYYSHRKAAYTAARCSILYLLFSCLVVYFVVLLFSYLVV